MSVLSCQRDHGNAPPLHGRDCVVVNVLYHPVIFMCSLFLEVSLQPRHVSQLVLVVGISADPVGNLLSAAHVEVLFEL